MRIRRAADDRGKASFDWLDSRHTFSFGHFHDPQWMGFGPLRVINEDRVAPKAGFAPHSHANMEILSYVLSGALSHRDNSGGGGIIRCGELQWMSAGHGVEHSEFNASDQEPVHFLQIWIQPDRLNAAPAYAQQAFDPASRRGSWTLLASPDGAQSSLAIRQQASLHGALLDASQTLVFALQADRKYWLHVAQGSIQADGRAMAAGDALGIDQEAAMLEVKGAGEGIADVLLFDLPL